MAASHVEAAQPRAGGGTARVDEADDGAVGQFGPESEAQAQLALIHAHHDGLALLDQQTTRAQAIRLHFARSRARAEFSKKGVNERTNAGERTNADTSHCHKSHELRDTYEYYFTLIKACVSQVRGP